MIKTKSNYFEEEKLQSRLQKLRREIYEPYKSVLGSENQILKQLQNSGQATQSQSILLKTREARDHSTVKRSLFSKKKTLKFPSISKKKSSMLSETKHELSIDDLISDPFLNGRIKNQRQQVYEKIEKKSNSQKFLQTVQKYEIRFLEDCSLKKYDEAEQIIARLLNYSIDLNLINQLCFSLKVLGDFHLNSLQFQKAFFYYNQCRKCGLFIGQYQLMAQSLIDMGICANKNNMYVQAIRLYKKALQYVWYYDLEALELRVYDEVGKAYYMMGDIQNAKHFHFKFFTGGIQPKDSSIRLLSKESLLLQGLEQMTKITNVTSVFLWMVHIPVRNCQMLQQLQNPQNKRTHESSPRQGYQKDMRYFYEYRTLNQAVYRIFSEDFFKNQLGDMHFNKNDWTDPIRIKKYLLYDIQRNNHLQSLGIPFQNYFSKGKQIKAKKKVKLVKRSQTQSLQNSSQQESSSKNLDKWYGNIASDAIRKHRNKNSGMLNRVNIRGLDKHSESNVATFRAIYNQFFDLFTLKQKKLTRN